MICADAETWIGVEIEKGDELKVQFGHRHENRALRCYTEV